MSAQAENLTSAAEAAAAAPEPRGWWSRPCGGREVLAIAMPLVIQTCFWSIMWFIDRLYLTWYSAEATAASLPGGMHFWTMICLPMGIAAYVNTFVAQYYGAGRYKRIGVAVTQAIWFGWLTVPLFLLAIPLAPWILRDVANSAEVVRLTTVYFQVLVFGAGAVVIAGAQSAYYTGRGLTGIVMLVNCAGTLLDISLEYAFIFGAGPFPELGIAGAAWTTVISNWATVLMFWLLMRRKRDRETYGLNDTRFDADLVRRLLRFGVPSAFPQLVEAASFTLLTRAVTRISAVAGAATSLAFTVNAVAFVPMIGLNIAVSTLVGQKLGENRPDLAARAVWTSLALGAIYTGLFALLYLAVPAGFLSLHSAFADDPNWPEIRSTTLVLLKFVALYCFFDAAQIVLVGALKGAGDTRFILYAQSLISIVAIGAGWFCEWLFAWRETGYGLWGWWWVITLWLLALGVTYMLRFLQGAWREMRVIEPEAPLDDEAGIPCTVALADEE